MKDYITIHINRNILRLFFLLCVILSCILFATYFLFSIYDSGYRNGYLDGEINERNEAYELFATTRCGEQFTAKDKDNYTFTFERKCPENTYGTFSPDTSLFWESATMPYTFVNYGIDTLASGGVE